VTALRAAVEPRLARSPQVALAGWPGP
jgi:hypothetical protein